MDYKLIATDIDGTLIDSNMELSSQNIAAMEKLNELGVTLVVSTGRSLSEVAKEILDLPQFRYYITSNGAATFDRQTGECIVSLGIEGDEKRFLFETLRKHRSIFTTHCNGRSYIDQTRMDRDLCHAWRMNDAFIDHVYAKDDAIVNYEAFCDGMETVENCCCFFPNDEELEACRADFLAHGGFSVSASMPDNLEICSIRAGKGTALLALAQKIGIDPAATIGVGDGTNDADNLQKAALGLAVSNADPLLLPYADQVICSNDEHVMDYILKNIIQ